MKSAIVRLLFVLVFCSLTKFAPAGDFVSAVIQAGQTLPAPITVQPDRFLVIRNFSQESGATTRGYVTVDTNGSGPVTVLTATILSANNTPALEPINDIVIAGPAVVNVTNPDSTANCFITYRKGTD